VSTVLKSGSNPLVPRVLLQWAGVTDPYVADGVGRIEILWRRPFGGWQQANVPGDSTQAYITGVDDGDVLTIEVRARNSLGQQGPSTYTTHTVDGAASLAWDELTSRPADSELLNSYVPTGANLIYNSAFEAGLEGWTFSNNVVTPDLGYGTNLNSNWTLAPAGAAWTSVFWAGQGARNGTTDAWFQWVSREIPVRTGSRYMLSAYLQAHRATVEVFEYFYDLAGSIVGTPAQMLCQLTSNPQADAKTLGTFTRPFSATVAPTGAAYARIAVRKRDTDSGSSDSYMFATRLLLEEVAADVAGPGVWSDASRQHVVTGTNVTSYIAAGGVSSMAQASSSSASLYSGSAASGYSNVFIDGPTFTLASSGSRVFASVIGRASYTLNTASPRMARPAFTLQLYSTSSSTVVDESGIFGSDSKMVDSSSTASAVNCSGALAFDAVAAGTYKVRAKFSVTITLADGTTDACMTASAFTGEVSSLELKA
jgi:hypothetical protein